MKMTPIQMGGQTASVRDEKGKKENERIRACNY